MSRWYRAYEGTVTDAKLHEAAMVAGVSRSVSIATWHAVLEACAAAKSARFDTTPRRIAVILGEPLSAIEGLFAAYAELGMIEDGEATAWGRRQFESDTSTERSRKHREAKRNVAATLRQQDATPPYTETDTEIEKPSVLERASKPAPKPRKPSADEKVFDILTDCLTADSARAVIEHRRAKGAKLTEAAARGLVKEFWKAHSPDDAAETMVVQGWQGFNIEWYRRAKPDAKIIDTTGAH